MAETVKKAKASAKPKKAASKKAEVAVEVTASKPVTAIDQPRVVSREEVARLAHRYWQERGHSHGNHVDDWFRAERELRGKAS